MRSGVTNPRYIHHRYVDSWLIHSYKIYRLEQESIVPFKDSVYATMQQGKTAEACFEMNAKQNSKDTETDNAIPSTSSHNQEPKEKKDEKVDNDLNKEEKEEKKEDSEINEKSGTSSHNQESKQKKDEKVNDLNKEEEEKKEDSEINEGNGTRSKKRMHKQRTCLLPQRDVYKSAQQLDFSYVLKRKK